MNTKGIAAIYRTGPRILVFYLLIQWFPCFIQILKRKFTTGIGEFKLHSQFSLNNGVYSVHCFGQKGLSTAISLRDFWLYKTIYD